MADNINVSEGSGKIIAADEIAGVLHQRVKISQGADGSATDVSSAAPLQVTLANTGSNATAVKVDGSAVTQPISGAVTLASTTITGTVAVTGTFYQATQPVSASSLPLPTGAATSAKQDSEIASLASIDGKITAVNTGAVTISSALPAGTNAIGKLSANSGIDIGDVDVTSVIPGTSASSLGKAEDATHTTGDTGVFVLAVRNDTLTDFTTTDGDYNPIATTASGRILTTHAPHSAMVTGNATTTTTSDTSVLAASGVGLKTYITDIEVSNTGSSTTLITIKDGNGGSTLGYLIAPSGGGVVKTYTTPLATTANTALYFACATASTTVYVSVQGYKAP